MATPTKRLYRNSTDSMLCGVSGGLAKYFDVDVTLVRLGWVVLTLITSGFAILVYIVMCCIVPEEGGSPDPSASRLGVAGVLGLALVGAGVVLLLIQLGFLGWPVWRIAVPIGVLGAGLLLLLDRK